MKDYFGAHMSISGGIHLAPGRGVEVGCGVIQVFTQNSNQWRGKPVSDSDALLFREKWLESGLNEVVSHDIYLVNLASAPGEVREKSLTAFREEMERCSRLGIGKIVMHPGAHLGEGEETGSEGLRGVQPPLRKSPNTRGRSSLRPPPDRFKRIPPAPETVIDGSSFPSGLRSASIPATPSPPATSAKKVRKTFAG
jgi:hypothetical protein